MSQSVDYGYGRCWRWIFNVLCSGFLSEKGGKAREKNCQGSVVMLNDLFFGYGRSG